MLLNFSGKKGLVDRSSQLCQILFPLIILERFYDCLVSWLNFFEFFFVAGKS
jgi:peptidoglycan biosynthesis protein MviN/MurJ (putative lipid II flippase)